MAGSDAGESSATNFAGLTKASSHMATDSDVIMNDGVAERAHGGAKKDFPSGDTSSALFPSLVDSSPPSPAQDASVNVSAALASADAMPLLFTHPPPSPREMLHPASPRLH